MATEKWLDIVQKLLAKAEDLATTPEERAALNDKVTYLMAKHSIDEALLNAKSKVKEEIFRVMVVIPDPYQKYKSTVLNMICGVFDCMAIMVQPTKYTIIGFNSDIEKVYLLYLSIITQMQTELLAVQDFRPDGVHGKSFNTSFLQGYVIEVTRKIRIAYNRAKEDVLRNTTGNGMALVLADRKDQVARRVKEFFPNLRTTSTIFNPSDTSAYLAGKRAGQRADVGSTRIGNNGSGRAIGS